jgi:hypothetical protein
MTTGVRQEQFMEQKVTYVLLKDGKLYVFENVPARVVKRQGNSSFHRRLSSICSILLGRSEIQLVLFKPQSTNIGR